MGRSRTPEPASGPGPRRCPASRPTEEGTLTLSAFDYEVSARITVAGRGRRGRHGARARPTARRHLPQPAGAADRRGHRRQQGPGHLRLQPVQPADDARRRLPHAALVARPPPAPSPATSSPRPWPRSAIAADRGDTLPILTGVRVEIEGDKVTLLATDRYRLAMRELTWNPEATDASHVALVPARTLSDTAKALGAAGSVEIALGSSAGGDGLIGFEAGQRRATTRLLDGEYPKVTSIFPSSVDTESVIETSALVEAVKRVALVAERNTPVRLKFTDGQVAIEAGTGDDAQASEAVEATLTGPDIEIAFNPQFLLDGLGAVGTAYSRLSFTQSSRPAVLSGQAEEDGEADTSYRYVLMPVRFAS